MNNSDWFMGLTLLVVVLLIYLAHLALQWWADRTTRPDKVQKRGIGGWLAFFIVSSATLGPLMLVGKTGSAFFMAEHEHPALRTWAPWMHYRWTTWVAVALLVALDWYVCWQLIRHKRPLSVWLTKALLVAAPLFMVGVDALATTVFLNVSPKFSSIAALIGGLVGSLIWYAYFARSVRVRNTYGLRQPGQAVASPAVPANNSSRVHATDGMSSTVPETPHQITSNRRPAEERLRSLRSLREQGLISEDEHARKKAEILAGL